MAKRSTTSTESHYSTIRLLAFVGLVLAGISGLLAFILWILAKFEVTIGWGERARSICSLISQIALFVTVWLAAWDYVKFKSKVWRVLYFVFLVLSILGLFGIGFF